MMAFAIYLVVLFPLVLVLAVMQGLGFGGSVFTSAFMPLGVPWFVLVYGLLVGCVMLAVGLVAMIGGIVSAQLLPLLSAPLGLVVATLIQASFYPMYRSIFSEPVTAVARAVS